MRQSAFELPQFLIGLDPTDDVTPYAVCLRRETTMQIQPTSVHAPQPISTPHTGRVESAETHSGFVAGGDEVSISREADLVARTHDLPEIRQERVAEIRAQLASGIYESDAKLDLALERLLDEIA